MIRALFFLVAGVTAEVAGGGKFAELVAYHVFSDINGYELVAVMYSESVAYEVRRYHGCAAPSLDDRLLARLFHGSYFLFELDGYKGSFF